jgi:aspartate carbamoyltransferase catalytic subunit
MIRDNKSLTKPTEGKMNNFYNKHIYSLKDFSREDLEYLFQVTDEMDAQQRKEGRISLLANKVMGVMFFQASTRTRLGFESAMLRLGGGVLGFADPKMTRSGDAFQEDLCDTVRMVQAYSDVIVMRHFITGAPLQAAKVATVPIINAGDGYGDHPTQTMIELYTINKVKGGLDGLRVAMIGDGNSRSMRSFAYGVSKWNLTSLTMVSPENLRWPNETVDTLKEMGQTCKYSSDIREVIDKVDVLYVMSVIQPSYSGGDKPADAWPDVPIEYTVNRDLLIRADSGLMVLAPLPRRKEISKDVDDLSQAYYFINAINGIPVRMALLSLIFDRIP